MQSKEFLQIFAIIFGSVGFWQFLSNVWQSRREKKNNQYDLIDYLRKGLLALLHSNLYDLCDTIIEQGYKTPEQVERIAYLTPPYFGLKGDGTLEKLLKIIDCLPIKKL